MDDKYIKMVKGRLRKYRKLLAMKKMKLNQYNDGIDPYANMSMDYGKTPSGSHIYNVSSRVENAILKQESIEYTAKKAIKEIERLDIAMEALTTIQKDIVEMKYIEGNDWGFVSSQLGYSERQCQREGKMALSIMVSVLYGEESYDLPLYNYIRGIV